ncbi:MULTISPECIES: response regulator [Butyricimonas]|nr:MULTISPECIES: response regulator [Butyricimonas]MCB6972365.1 response regulator [Butyricimonas synergistica]MCG4519373.1 response regulator [Butyricimonas sp. DFI.6.44]
MNSNNDRVETSKSKTILVAEDNESNFLLVFTVLKKDYSIIRAHNGVEAIDKFKSESPDIILMDIKMPEMDGLTATRKIREYDTRIPIIALSAFAFETDKQEAISAGCNDYITKPVDFNLLRATLKRHQTE